MPLRSIRPPGACQPRSDRSSPSIRLHCATPYRWDKDWPLKRSHPDYELCEWLCNNPFGDGPVCIIFAGAVKFAHPVPFVGNTGLRRIDPSVLHAEDIAQVNAKLLRPFLRYNGAVPEANRAQK
jgi:hypothetical protein